MMIEFAQAKAWWRLLPILLLLSCLGLTCGAPRSWGEKGVTAGSPVEEPPPGAPFGNGEAGEEDTLLERAIDAIDERHEQLSSRVLTTAHWLDSFFASERLDDEAQKTRAVLGFSIFAEDSRSVQFDLASRFRLSLPFLSDRLQFVLAGDPDDEIGTDPVSRQELRQRLQEQKDPTVTLGLRYQIRHSLLRNISLRGGVRVRSGEPVLLLGPRYRQDTPLGPSWLFRYTQSFIAFSNDNYEARTAFDLERPLLESTDRFFLRITAEGNWQSDLPGYGHALHLNLYQSLSPRRVIDYRISNYFQTRPNHRWESTVLSVLYRQMLGRDWLFAEMAPQLTFPRDRNFQPTLGALLNFGVIIGNY